MVRFVLHGANRQEAACAMEQSFDGLRCAFVAPALRSSPLASDTLLQPFESIDGRTFLIGGMWASPDVQEHMKATEEPFQVSCSVLVLGTARQARLRVGANAGWTDLDEFLVGRVGDCAVRRTMASARAERDIPAPSAPSAPADRVHFPVASYSPRWGPAHAKVTMMVFSDFECPHCANLAPTLRLVADANPKTLALHLRHFPLPSHHRATPAAVAVQAAERQGMGWALSDLLFGNQKALTDADILTYASTLKLKVSTFKLALHNPTVGQEVDQDLSMARGSGVIRGTPTVFVNGQKYDGARTETAFQAVIDDEVKRADVLLAAGVPLANIYERLCQ
jgi:protein-disulfide isomerase